MITRDLSKNLTDAMADTPVVLINGARQTGKSTLAQWYAELHPDARYLTMDDANTLGAALDDPAGFLAGNPGPLILDEVQRVPALFPAIKMAVDNARKPGSFLLTGSADILMLPTIAESLAGRVEILTLWPFSMHEIAQLATPFLEHLFLDAPLEMPRGTAPREDLMSLILRGGYPEAVARNSVDRRNAWFASYLVTILQRDVREFANVDNPAALLRLLRLIASRSTALANFAEYSRSLGIPAGTLRRYVRLLEMAFLVKEVPAWSANLGKRLVRSPKVVLTDTGLYAHLLGFDQPQSVRAELRGPLVENFVFMELEKQRASSMHAVTLHHFRDPSGKEVDIVLEDRQGRVVGIEVKASTTVTPDDFKHLRFLEKNLGDRFLRGVVFHMGQSPVSFGRNLHGLPISALWQGVEGRLGDACGPGV